MADNIMGFKFPKNRQKWPSISMFKHPRTDSKRLTSHKTDVIGLQTLGAVGGLAACTRPFIASGKLLWLCILHLPIYNATIVSATVRLFSLCKIYTAFVCNLFYRLVHKKIPYAVC